MVTTMAFFQGLILVLPEAIQFTRSNHTPSRSQNEAAEEAQAEASHGETKAAREPGASRASDEQERLGDGGIRAAANVDRYSYQGVGILPALRCASELVL